MKKRLEKYNENICEINSLKRKIVKLKNEEAQPSFSKLDITGIKAKGFNGNPIENKAINNADKIASCEKRIEELEAEIKVIDSAIKILKSRDQKVIKDYFINKKSAIEIGKEIDREEKTVYVIIKNSIKKMEIILK